MNCAKCNGNMVKSYEDENPKCIQCGYQIARIPKEILKEVKKAKGQNIIESNPHEPKYYYDHNYRDSVILKNK